MKRMTVSVTQSHSSVEAFFTEAEAGAGPSAWVLFEMPKKAGLVRLVDCKIREMADASRIIVFSERGEWRMEKPFWEQHGRVRVVRTGTEKGQDYRMREQIYLLRSDSSVRGCLVCREFFCPDETGMLRLACECLAGVREGE